ncbi:hypothetical protein CIPAW_04G156800 [Carya illinoinensis]|uniref:non-specific serine/threonine protein kinase n=1 Tax=Carya illinoinensis TaxID=32201 RepID=A0A8T1QTP2_CARIL|nr:hypothetical protein CIPAW_04G156800 [Carya illinoinensis]
MSRLRELSLEGNNFDGNIPASIGRLTELRKLMLITCPLIGSFPPEIGNLSNLEELGLADNSKIVSTFPSEFGKLKKLKFLWMANTNLIGEIPNTIGEMEALEHLDLSTNSLTGKIPDSLFMPKNLRIIPRVVKALNLNFVDLSENNLLKNLTSLALFLNQLSGKIPDSIGRLPRLIHLGLFNNNFSGSLPLELGSYSMLKRLWVSTNKLTGQLPEHLCDNGKLVEVIASENQLVGDLELVKIYRNNFSGNIPSGLWTSSNLNMLMLSDNSFTGELPERLAWNLSRLEMNNNKNLLVLKANLSGLTTLFLDQNRLSGTLPSDINSWKLLNTLNLSRNEISGQIPKELGSLLGLTELDLSENQLSGPIPSKLGLLKLTSFNLSSNHLTGNIPSEFENDAYAHSFLNNPGLCANRPSRYLNLENCSSRRQKSSKTYYKLIAWITGLVVVVLLANNLIGFGRSGHVYHVVINHSGDILEGKLEKELMAKVQIFSSIRNANMVKLLYCISNDNSKLLVYKYLDNCSLDRWLHRKSRATTFSSSVNHTILDWSKRLCIAVGATQGLSYMHRDCSPPIVHRDMKSSNILLDLDFNAQITDFGLAKILIKERELATMLAVAGSFGYTAPEYARTTRINEKIDVYSFGVIILELTIGRKANDDGKPIGDALDQEVKEPCRLNEMCHVFKLGLYCTSTQPSTRTSIKEVLKVLLQCSQPVKN